MPGRDRHRTSSATSAARSTSTRAASASGRRARAEDGRAGRGDLGAPRDLAGPRGHRRALLRGLQRGPGVDRRGEAGVAGVAPYALDPANAERLWERLAGPDRLSSGGPTMAEATGHDEYGPRRPTSHERRAGEPWDASYRDGPAPWDIGGAAARDRAPGGRRRVHRRGARRRLRDRRERPAHRLPGAARLGVDVAETALSIAREKAAAAASTPSSWSPTHCTSTARSRVRHGARLRPVPHVRRRRAARVRGEPRVGDGPADGSTSSASATSAPRPPARIRSPRTSCGRRSGPAAAGASPPSTPIGCGRA